MSSRLREVVESLLELLDDFGINEEIVSISHENIVHRESLKTERTLAILRKAKSALAEPLKNCEVGTVEEQTERFRKFCFAHMKKGGGDFSCHKNCPAKNYIGGWGIPYCQLKWGQMPYESEVKDETIRNAYRIQN